MIIILTLQLISATSGLIDTLVLVLYLEYFKNSYVAKIAYALFNVVWFAAYSESVWLFAFKYWQTSFELKYLFRMESRERVLKQTKMYMVFNLVQILIIAGYAVMLIVSVLTK